MAVRKLLRRNLILATGVCLLVGYILKRSFSYHSSTPTVDPPGNTRLESFSVFIAEPKSYNVSVREDDRGVVKDVSVPKDDGNVASKDISVPDGDRGVVNNVSVREDDSNVVTEIQPTALTDAGSDHTGEVEEVDSQNGRITVQLFKNSSMLTGRTLQLEHNDRQKAIVEACKHAWMGYKKFAWGKDELKPVSRHWINDFNMGLTLIDSLDTLWLMGLQKEFDEARLWVENSLTFQQDKSVSVFETTIRVLGGLLSAYHLSNEDIFLQKARELADSLLPAFNSRSGLPFSRVNIKTGRPQSSSKISIAEAGSLQLEFRDLSQTTGDAKYQEAVDRAMNVILSVDKTLLPEYIGTSTGAVFSGALTIGARTDSYYEYLLKQWLQSAKSEDKFLKRYLSVVAEVNRTLIGYSSPSHLPFAGRWSGRLENAMEHLACFYPGLLALGLSNDLHTEQTGLAKGLAESCYQMYNQTPTGLAAEISHFNTENTLPQDISVTVDGYNLRPETVESLFLLHRLTKDNKYREWGWKIFEAIEKYGKVPSGGYSSVIAVQKPSVSVGNLKDKMETFYLAETLKYLFLLFCDDETVLSLEEWVFNTEAHPLPIWTTGN